MQRPEMRQLKQRIIAAYHLGPLDRAETQQYIEYRLAHVGWNGDPSFEAAAFDRIFALSHGIPRRINTLVDRLLLAGYLGEKHALSESEVVEVAAELKMELGPRRNFVGAIEAAPNGTATSASHGDAGNEIPGGNAETEREAAPPGSLASLEERLALLEATTGMIFGTLKKVLRMLRSRASEGERDVA